MGFFAKYFKFVFTNAFVAFLSVYCESVLYRYNSCLHCEQLQLFIATEHGRCGLQFKDVG